MRAVAPVTGRSGRANQRWRTRKDLLRAAAQLTRDGGTPTLDEVAAAAMVSRATAYRYFPNLEALLLEAALDIALPEPEELFAGAADGDPKNGDPEDGDPIRRLERVAAALDAMIGANEAQLRTMLAHSLQRRARGTDGVPARQNRRTPLIEAALEPARAAFGPATHARLCAALAVLLGTESAIVFKDVLQMEDSDAADVRRWAIGALVAAARRDGAG
ncbi:MAG: TetR family transcriptional regulator [Alphaproteobacteria bacterium]